MGYNFIESKVTNLNDIDFPRYVRRDSEVLREHAAIAQTQFENENKEGYINGFTENYVKVKSPWNPELVNTLHKIKLTKIDEDGLVRFDFLQEKIKV